MSRGHVALRSCAVCGTKTDKQDLIRLSRDQAGHISIDESGKSPGRGVYLCHTGSCWNNAISKGRLAHKLKSPLSSDDRLSLTGYLGTLAGDRSQTGTG